MQFNRKWFYQPRDTTGGSSEAYQDALNSPDNILWFLKKNGFVQRNGSDITDFQSIRWKYDTDNKIFFQPEIFSDWRRVWNLMWQYRFSNDTKIQDESILFHDYDDHQTEFFIPLKNQGFIIVNYRKLSELYGFTPTPPLHTISSAPEFTTGSMICIRTTIGIFNNVTNKYNYLFGSRNGNISSWSYTRLLFYLADQIMDAQKMPFVEQTNGNGSWGSFGNYTDVKQNICTMIKYPYNNSFMSNLFLITTAPRYGESNTGASACGLDNKFFSFNGRNFYGVYSNLAVELPTN